MPIQRYEPSEDSEGEHFIGTEEMRATRRMAESSQQDIYQRGVDDGRKELEAELVALKASLAEREQETRRDVLTELLIVCEGYERVIGVEKYIQQEIRRMEEQAALADSAHNPKLGE